MKSILTPIARYFVGVLFIISGLIKLNDPVGFSFKLEEYFSPGVLNMEFLMEYALSLSMFIVVVEVLLGVFLLLGYQLKCTLYSLIGMIVFFTFLTFYSAYFNKVTDCGCFGDAIKLTPWESFTKDVILLVLIVYLWINRNLISPLRTRKFRTIAVLVSMLISLFYLAYVYSHLPQVDFRAYKIGVHIPSAMEVPEDAPQAIYNYHWTFEENGSKKVYTTNGSYPTIDGEFIGVETELVQKGYEPPIHDFGMENDRGDQTQQLLSEDLLFLFISYDLDKSNKEAIAQFEQLAKSARDKGYRVALLTASSKEVINAKLGNESSIESFFSDQTALKTIVRSNPGALVVKKGVITDKKHFNDFDKIEF